MASGHCEAPHPKAGHMAAPTSNSASGQQSSCQHRAVHTWRKPDASGGRYEVDLASRSDL